MAIDPRSFVLIPEERGDRVFTDYHRMHRRAAGEQDADAPRFDIPAAGTRYPRSSLPALAAALWVRETRPERFQAFDLAVFEAFLASSRDISDPEVLAAVAESVGLDGRALRAALGDERLRGRVMEEHLEAVRAGLHAIPAVLIPGRAPVVGAVPYAELHRVVQAALPARGVARGSR